MIKKNNNHDLLKIENFGIDLIGRDVELDTEKINSS